MKCKYHLLLVFLSIVMLGSTVQAQVTMSVQVPPTGLLQKNQLWNLVLVSTSNDPVIVRIKITLLSTKDNSPVMSGVSRTFSITKGVKQIGSNDVAPIQYDYLSAIFNVDRNPNGLLPIGNFLACYTVTKIIGDAMSELSEECLPVEVAPLSPPLLNTPFDKDTLTTSYPNFTWLPPAPLNLFSDLSYDLSLVEVQSGQAATQAIQQNIPIYTANRLTTPTNAYPASNKALDTAKLYAWRIAANNNGQLVAQSDVWTFQVGLRGNISKRVANGNYVLLRDQSLNAGITTINDYKIGLKYYSYDKARQANIRFSDLAGNLIYSATTNIIYGDNYLTIELGKTFQKGRIYIVDIEDASHHYYSASFKIKPIQN